MFSGKNSRVMLYSLYRRTREGWSPHENRCPPDLYNVKGVFSFTASRQAVTNAKGPFKKRGCLLTSMVLGAGVGTAGAWPPAGED